MGHGILLSGGSEVDFMIHGVFQYNFFGHPVWITTSHVCILIVMLLLIAFAIAANRCMAKASEVPGSLQNVVEMIVEMLAPWGSPLRDFIIISEPFLSLFWSAIFPACWAYGPPRRITVSHCRWQF